MNPVKIICPYVFEEEIRPLKNLYWELDFDFQQDTSRIGSDLMFQKMWKKYPNHDIIIFHADMSAPEGQEPTKWYYDLLSYVKRFPKAGIFGCKLLYPATNDDGNFWVQSAGGFINENGLPEHYGSGLVIENSTFWKEGETDLGQYDSIREVAWTTFGGCYIRREVLDDVGDFPAIYEHTYNRDVDYCLRARENGWKIYQVPSTIIHWESRDNKRTMSPEHRQMEQRNRDRLVDIWSSNDLYKTIDKVVENK